MSKSKANFIFKKNSYQLMMKFISQHLLLRYRRTFLGYLWTLINPLLMMAVLAFVFSTLFNHDIKTFAVFLFAAFIPWNFFSYTITQCAGCFIANENLIKQIYIPKYVFPLSVTIALLIDSILALLALFIIIIIVGAPITKALVYLPISYILLFLFSLGIGLACSILTIYFRDIQHLISILLQGLFFLSPILYKHGTISGEYAWIMNLNPIIPYIDMFRKPIYEGIMPSHETTILALILSVATLVIGFTIYILNHKKIVYRL